MTEIEFLDALKEAINRVGTQTELAKRAGVSQGTVSDYINGRCSIGNMTVSTLIRFFPDMAINFFGEKAPTEGKERRRNMLLRIFEPLSEERQLEAIAMMAANFGEKIREETKR